MDQPVGKNEKIGNAIKQAMSPAQEPVMWGTVIGNLAIVYLALFADLGYEIPDTAVAAVVATITALGLLLRSQYTPFARK